MTNNKRLSLVPKRAVPRNARNGNASMPGAALYPCSEDRRTEPGAQSESRPEHSAFEQRFRLKLEQRCRAPQRGRLSRPEPRFRQPQRSRAGLNSDFDRPSETERARAAILNAPARPRELERMLRAPATPTGLERLFQAPQRLRGGFEQRFRAPRWLRGGLERLFRAPRGLIFMLLVLTVWDQFIISYPVFRN